MTKDHSIELIDKVVPCVGIVVLAILVSCLLITAISWTVLLFKAAFLN